MAKASRSRWAGILACLFVVSLTGCKTIKGILGIHDEYTLTVTTAGSGSVSRDPERGKYEEGTHVQLTATAAEGSAFTGWSGGLTGSQNPATITMNGDISVTAHFEVATYTLTTTVTGSGNIARNPEQDDYAAGSDVQLTAVPQPGYAFSNWSGSLSGSQNPATVSMTADLTVAATFVAATHTLTVAKSGLGTGTVSGTGIDCGSDCSQDFSSGSVLLTASPGVGSVFAGWTGCDSTSGDTCTVTMTADRSVTATFNNFVPTPAYSVSVPPSSTTGGYDVTVTCTGLCSTSFQLQEAPDVSFDSPVQTAYTGSTYPKVISISGKAPGTYCYRASGGLSDWSPAACVTVSSPSTAVLRIENTSSYDIIDLKLDGVQQLEYPYVVPAGGAVEFVLSSPGTVNVNAGNGYYGSGQSRDVWFTLTASPLLILGETTTVQFPNPTIGQLLSGFSSSANWDGPYFAGTSSFFARFTFTGTGGWQFYDSSAPCFGGSTCSFSLVGSGTVTLVSWPQYSSIVTFTLGNGTGAIYLSYPFGSFQFENGPADWSIIEYTRQ